MNFSEPSKSSEHSDQVEQPGDAAFHDQLKSVLLDVEVPDGLKDSILDSLVQSNENVLISDQPAISPRKSFLKKPGVLAGLSACLVFAAMLVSFFVAQGPVIDLSEFSPKLNLDRRFLSEFDNNFSERLPTQGGWRFKGRLNFTPNSYGVFVDQSSAHEPKSPVHDTVVRFFTLNTGKAQPVYGAILQVPARRVAPLPSHTHFDPGNVEYSQLKKGNYATVKWIEDDQVYICIVFGGARELEALGRALQAASA